MGSFNKIGFYSNIPITEMNDIVLFICADSLINTKDSSPVGINSLYEPISLPIYGKYNSYGCICNIEKDENVISIEKSFNISIEELIESIDYCSFCTYNDILQKEKTNYIFEGYVKNYKNILNKIIDKTIIYSSTLDNVSLFLTMEHKSVFDKIKNFERNDTYAKIIDKILNLLNDENNLKRNIFNYFIVKDDLTTKEYYNDLRNNISYNEAYKKHIEKYTEIIPHNDYKLSDYIKVMSKMDSSLYEMMIYNVVKLDFATYKERLIDFLLFNKNLDRLSGKYNTSNYMTQEIDSIKNYFVELHELYNKIIINQ